MGLLAIVTGVALVISGAPALATTGLDGPPTPVTGDPITTTSAQNEMQKITLLDATGGTFKVTYTDATGKCTSPSISYNAAAAAVDTALAGTWTASSPTPLCALPRVDADITVTGGPLGGAGATSVTVEFTGANANTNVFQLAASTSGTLTPSSTTSPTNPARGYVSTVQNGRYTGTGASAPAAADVDPHGGYSSTTDYCLQCHAVHSYEYPANTVVGPGEYALLVRDSVTDTCNTCHKLFGGTGGTSAVNSNAITGAAAAGLTLSMGTTAVRTAYDLTGSTSPARAGGHALGVDSSPLPDGVEMQGLGWTYGSFNGLNWYLDNEAAPAGTSHAAGDTNDPGADGGLYCGSCHTPHGEFGQAVNTAFYRSNAGADALNAAQYVFVEGLTIGTDTWTLTFNGQTTTALAADITTGALDTALEGLSTIGVGNVTVSGTPLSATNLVGNYKITFAGSMASATQPQMTATDTSATGTVKVVTSQGGSAAVTEETPNAQGNAALAGTTLAAVRTFADDKPIFQYNALNRPQTYYLNQPGDPTSNPTNTGGNASAWERCTSTDGAGTPTGCEFLTIVDSEGQVVYEYGYKLLTAYPNHNWLKAESWGLGYRGTDSSRWCGSCHGSKVSPDFGVTGEYAVAGVTYHSHPTACYYCHGNPADSSATPSYDFPHTSSVGSLLKQYPDALCISCHTAGSLP